jgi:dTDP-4-amino-4,6-dideoxygalactose transaminase
MGSILVSYQKRAYKLSVLREIPPTAGFPLYAKDFLSIFLKKNRQGSLEEDFKNYFDAPYAKVTYSGTAAFYLILESLKGSSSRKTVIIPSFICPLVPLAIHRAGLRVAVCDINKDNFNFDSRQLQALCLQNDDILAIVAVHLGGIPIDFEEIKQIAKKNKIFIIEDCAQSLGAVYKDRKVGTLGDLSFFSLCRGKSLTIYEGGVIITKKESNSVKIDATIERIVNNDFFSESLKILELMGYWIFYRPQLFWWAFRLPQIYWDSRGEHLKALTEYFTIDFPLHKVSKIRKSIGHVTFARLEKEIYKQRQKASRYIENLKDIPGIKLITESPGTRATYPYLTLLFNDPIKCKKAKEIFRNSGLGVFQIYAMAITDYDYLKGMVKNKDCPNARSLAQNHITLTTSTFLRNKDLNSVLDIIKLLKI